MKNKILILTTIISIGIAILTKYPDAKKYLDFFYEKFIADHPYEFSSLAFGTLGLYLKVGTRKKTKLETQTINGKTYVKADLKSFDFEKNTRIRTYGFREGDKTIPSAELKHLKCFLHFNYKSRAFELCGIEHASITPLRNKENKLINCFFNPDEIIYSLGKKPIELKYKSKPFKKFLKDRRLDPAMKKRIESRDLFFFEFCRNHYLITD